MTEKPSGGRTALLAAMVVALTAGMLALAGTTPKGIGAPVAPGARVVLDQRTFVCDGSLPRTTVTQGSTEGDAAPDKAATEPLVIEVGRRQAAGAYAAQAASKPLWTAWIPCPEAHARWWFVGAGGAEVTHDTVLSITNPRNGAAVLDIDVYGPEGPVVAPGLKGITVPAGATQEIDLAKAAPAVGELAVKIVARRGLVAITAADAYSPRGVGKEVREWVPPQSLPATEVNLAGLPTKPADSSLVVVNPGTAEAIATIEVIGTTGTFVPDKVQALSVPPQSVATVPLTSVYNGTALAVRVKSENRITATIRSSQSGDIGYATGVRPILGTTAFAVPPGALRQLALSSLGRAGTITMTTYDRTGRTLSTAQVTVPAGTTLAVALPPKVRSVQLTSTSPTTIAGLLTTRPEGLDTAGVSPALRSIRLPVLRSGW
jgi:hypothetical protein